MCNTAKNIRFIIITSLHTYSKVDSKLAANNLHEEIVYNENAANTESFYFYNFIINNATEFTTEQYDTYNSGYNIGYNVGVDFGTTSTKWIQSVFGAVDDILQVEILPNFKLWYLIGIPLLFSAVIFVFKILR